MRPVRVPDRDGSCRSGEPPANDARPPPSSPGSDVCDLEAGGEFGAAREAGTTDGATNEVAARLSDEIIWKSGCLC